MRNKQSLYTKYRPNNFDEVVGQKVAKDILVNSIIKNKINHAYLFYGIRGTGKTTLARIFSKSINCPSFEEENNPCNKCDSCKGINNGSSFDVIEIDAASNNGVDEIRTIKENINYLTTDTNYKVYIIDEVHMLTKAAFNALLKTLEEPPRNTIFLLATTEIQKIPSTVLSRTIIINLEVMSEKDIEKGLKVILEGEKVIYEEEVLPYLTLISGGSLRDAISSLETSLLYNEELTVENVVESLGIIDRENIKRMLLANSDDLIFELDDSKKDPKKITLIILDVLIELIKGGENKFVKLLNELISSTCNIKDPFLLLIALKTSLINVSRETVEIKQTVINNKDDIETKFSKSKEDIDTIERKNNIDVPRETEEDSIELKENIKTKLEESKKVDIDISSETIYYSDYKKNNSKEQLVDVPRETSKTKTTFINEAKTKEVNIPKNASNVITDYVSANNYIYTMIKSDSLSLDKIKGKWRHIDNYITSIDYKDIVFSLIKTSPLATYGKTIIVGFTNKQQINEFKHISLSPLFFKFIKDILGEHKFILPIDKEKWSQLVNVKKSGYKLTSVNKDIGLEFETFLINNNDVKEKTIEELFGKENIIYE